MRIAVYGGSFNPPHVGHGMVAAWLLWTGRVDEVWLVPAWRHAFDKPLAPFPARIAACEALAAHISPRVRVSPIERDLPAPSYTIRTLDTLADRHPNATFQLVVGSDVIPQLPSWHRWEDIAARYSPIIVNRAGHATSGDGPVFPEVSSTDVRARVAAGQPVDAWVPTGVIDAWLAR